MVAALSGPYPYSSSRKIAMAHTEDTHPKKSTTSLESPRHDSLKADGTTRPLARAGSLEEGLGRGPGLAAAEGLVTEARRLRAESQAALAELNDAAGRYVLGEAYFQPPQRFP